MGRNPITRTYRGVTTVNGEQIEGLLEIVDIGMNFSSVIEMHIPMLYSRGDS